MALTTGKGILRFTTIDGQTLCLGYSTYSLAQTDAAAILAAMAAGTRVMITLGDGTQYLLSQTAGPEAYAVDAVVTG
jgi:hypothetical protein